MRKTVGDMIGTRKQDRKIKNAMSHRQNKQDEKDMKEIMKFKKKKLLDNKKQTPNNKKRALSNIEQERVWKLLSRGMPSQNYNNLAKS